MSAHHFNSAISTEAATKQFNCSNFSCFNAVMDLSSFFPQNQLSNAHLTDLSKSNSFSSQKVNELEIPNMNQNPYMNLFCIPINNSVDPLEIQIKNMINFFINSYGIIRVKEVLRIREQYAEQSDTLVEIFDALSEKYSLSKKPKEELVKWIIRKVLMTCNQTKTKTKKITQKNLSNILFQRYYLIKAKKEENNDDDESETEERIPNILPFKISKSKIFNNHFVEQLFKSEGFKQDYDIFMGRFDDLIEKETMEKVEKFSNFMLGCIRENKVDSIKKFRGAPWQKSCIEKTKRIAIELENKYMVLDQSKSIKLEFTSE